MNNNVYRSVLWHRDHDYDGYTHNDRDYNNKSLSGSNTNINGFVSIFFQKYERNELWKMFHVVLIFRAHRPWLCSSYV